MNIPLVVNKFRYKILFYTCLKTEIKTQMLSLKEVIHQSSSLNPLMAMQPRSNKGELGRQRCCADADFSCGIATHKINCKRAIQV
jgi:hypothetical protein